jgi:hypothetical protein
VEKLDRVEVIEEALDVEKEGGGNMAMVDGRLGKVGEVCSTINHGVIVVATELEGAEKLVHVEVVHEALCNNLF